MIGTAEKRGQRGHQQCDRSAAEVDRQQVSNSHPAIATFASEVIDEALAEEQQRDEQRKERGTTAAPTTAASTSHEWREGERERERERERHRLNLTRIPTEDCSRSRHREQPAEAGNNRCRGQLPTWKQNRQPKHQLNSMTAKEARGPASRYRTPDAELARKLLRQKLERTVLLWQSPLKKELTGIVRKQ